MKQLNKIQLNILKKLLFADELRYTDLKPGPAMENNQLDFHVKELIKLGYIAKGRYLYSLTGLGKEYANRMDTETVKVPLQAKISAWLCARKEDKYLIYTRLKQPFYGLQGFPSGKVEFGEKVLNAAKRELKEETNLSGDAKVVAIKHYSVLDKKTKKLLEDKFMFLCVFDNPTGKLKNNGKEGKYEWVAKRDFENYLNKPFESYSEFKRIVAMAENFKGNLVFVEHDHLTDKF